MPAANTFDPPGAQKWSGLYTDDGNAAAAVVTYDPNAWVPLCAYQGDADADPVPVVLTVDSPLKTAGPTTWPWPTELPLFASFVPDWQAELLTGALRVTYGGRAVNTRLMDVRSGVYQLPPATYVKVEIQRWFPSGIFTGAPATVGVELLPGDAPSPAEWLYTGRRQFAGGAGLGILTAPPGVRYWRFAREELGGAIDAQISVSRGVQPNYYVDYSLTPPTISPPVADLASTAPVAIVEKTGADPLDLIAQAVVTP